MQKIKKDDEVIVIKGKDKGKRGKVLRVIKDTCRLVVEGVNLTKKHIKPNPRLNIEGGIIDVEAPIARANIALFNPMTKKADKIGIRVLEDGRRVRHFKSNNELVEI